MRLSRNGRTDDVDNPDIERSLLETVPHCENGIGRLPRLRDEQAGVVAENGRLPVKEVGCQLHGTGDLCQFLEDGSGLRLSRGKSEESQKTSSQRNRLTARQEWKDVPQATKTIRLHRRMIGR